MAILFFVFLVLLPSQLGKHWWPQWSLVSGVRVDYLSPTLYLTDIILVLLIGVVLWRNRKNGGVLKRFFSFRFFLFPFSFFLFPLLSPRPLLSFYWLLRYGQIPLIAFFTLALIKRERFNAVNRFVFTGLSLAVIWTVALSIIQMGLGRTTSLLWILGERSFTIATPGIATLSVFGRTILRPYATFPHPNAMAGFLGVCFLLLSTRLFQRGRRTRVAHLSVGAKLVNLRGELVAVVRPSRASLRASGDSERANFRQRATTIRDTFFIRLSRALAGIGVLLSTSRLAIVSLVIASVIPLGFSRAPAAVMFSPQSTEERLILTRAALAMIRDHPLFGVGPGQFLVKLPDYLPRGTWLLQPVHNIPLLLLSEFGIIGSALAAVIFWKFLTSATSRSLLTTHYSLLFFLLLTSLGDHYWVTVQQNRILLGVVLALVSSHSLSSSAQRRVGANDPRPPKTL